ncbi:MAG: TIGR01458 family HAD-type hydrolase [bacterium]|nr:TIGR01458 family HAD-type hydrolase [bacterium]
MRRDLLSHIRGLLIDLDGVLYIGDRAIEGAAESVRRLKTQGIPLRFTTNTTTRSQRELRDKLISHSIPVEQEEIFGVLQAAVAYLKQRGRPDCRFLLTDGPLSEFDEFPRNDLHPEYIIVGDIGKRWDYNLMNEVFALLSAGADLLALHKGKFWQTEEGLRVDIGAFVAGLEYVTGKTATVLGKPSKDFFHLALADLGLPAEQVAMIGDDVESDVGGALKVGMTGILVRTGKFREDLVSRSGITPDLTIDSIADLPSLLGGIGGS